MTYTKYHKEMTELISSIEGLELNFSNAFGESYYWFSFNIKGSKSQQKAALKEARKKLNAFWINIVQIKVEIPEIPQYQYIPDIQANLEMERIISDARYEREKALQHLNALEHFKTTYRVAFESF